MITNANNLHNTIKSKLWAIIILIREINHKYLRKNSLIFFKDNGVEVYNLCNSLPAVKAEFKELICQLANIFIERVNRDQLKTQIMPSLRHRLGLGELIESYLNLGFYPGTRNHKQTHPSNAKTAKRKIQNIINLRNAFNHTEPDVIQKGNDVIRNWFRKNENWLTVQDVSEWDKVLIRCLDESQEALKKFNKGI